MSEKDLVYLVRTQLEESMIENDEDVFDDSEIDSILSYEEAGVLSSDDGLLIKMKNGSEFCLSIIRRK